MAMKTRQSTMLFGAFWGLLCLTAAVESFQPNIPAAPVRRKAVVGPLETVVEIPIHLASADAVEEQKGEVFTPQTSLPPVIQQIADNRAEFQINLGRAMDTLRRDMPEILSRKPDFSIYDDDISVIDPSGVQLTGIEKYKSSFAFFQTFIRFWFKDSGLQYRMVYDFCRSSIRVTWHAVLIPKVPFGRPLHVDGVSYYQLNPDTGKINEHKLERLVMNNTPVVPPYGIMSLLQQDALGMRPQGVPAGVGLGVFQ